MLQFSFFIILSQTVTDLNRSSTVITGPETLLSLMQAGVLCSQLYGVLIHAVSSITQSNSMTLPETADLTRRHRSEVCALQFSYFFFFYYYFVWTLDGCLSSVHWIVFNCKSDLHT